VLLKKTLEVKVLDEKEVGALILLAFAALSIGGIVYAWMVSARLPTIIAGPIGVFSFLVVLAAFFGITGVVIVAIKAISDLLS
jgi:hypothetical protein